MPHSACARRIAILRRFARNGGLAQERVIEACLEQYLRGVIRELKTAGISVATPGDVALAVARSQGLKLS